MDFIRTYFSVKFEALGRLLGLVKSAWDERIWLAVILMVLWTMVCTIGGILVLPIDFIGCCIGWHMNPDFKEATKMVENALASDEE
jgi:hypothetical protein